MDKKLLVSLMAVAPVSAFAQMAWTGPADETGFLSADVPATAKSGWLPQTSVNEWETKEAEAVDGKSYLICNVGSTYMHMDFTAAKGTYKFDFAELPLNAYAVIEGSFDKGAKKEVIVGVKNTTTGKVTPSKTATVNFDGGCTMVVKIVQVDDTKSFGVSKMTVTLEYDMATAKSAVLDAYDGMDAIENFNGVDDSFKAYANEQGLVSQCTALETEKTKLNEKITDLRSADAAGLWAQYNTDPGFPDFNPDATVSATNNPLPLGVSAFIAKVDTYNKAYDKAYKEWKNLNDNQTNLDNLQNLVDPLAAALNKAIRAYEASVAPAAPTAPKQSDYKNDPDGYAAAMKQYQADKDVYDFQIFAGTQYKTLITADIEKLGKDIEKAYSGDLKASLVPVDVFVVQYQVIWDKINDIGYSYASYDWSLFPNFASTQTALEQARANTFAKLNKDQYKKVEDPKNPGQPVYDDLVDEYNQKLSDLYQNGDISFEYNGELMGVFGANNLALQYYGGQVTDNANIVFANGTYWTARNQVNGGSVYVYGQDRNELFTNPLLHIQYNVLGLIPAMQSLFDKMDAKFNEQQNAYYGYGEDVDGTTTHVEGASEVVAGFQFQCNGMNSLCESELFSENTDEDAPAATKQLAKNVIDAKDAVQKAINVLDKYVYEQYMAHTLDLTAEDYLALKSAVETAITGYNTAVAALDPTGALELLNELYDEYAKVETLADGSDVKKYNLADQFSTQKQNIENSITSFAGLDFDEMDEDYIKDLKSGIEKTIKGLKPQAQALVDAFAAADAQLSDAQDALDAYLEAAADKTYLDGVSDKLVDIYKVGIQVFNKNGALEWDAITPDKIQELITNAETKLKNIANVEVYKTPQAAMDAANEFSDVLKTADWAASINNGIRNFNTYVTNQNYAVAKAAYDKAVNAAQYRYFIDADGNTVYGWNVEGWPNNTDNSIGDFLPVGVPTYWMNDNGNSETYAQEEIKNAVSLSDLDNMLAGLDNCDQVLADYLKAANKMYAQFEPAIQNYLAYQALDNSLNNIASYLNGNVWDEDGNRYNFVQSIKNSTTEVAWAPYIGQDGTGNGGKCKEFKEAVANIKNQVKNSYKNLSEVADKANYEESIKNLKAEIQQTLDDCANNYADYQKLLQENTDVLNLAQTVIDNINKTDKLGAHKQKVLDDIQDQTIAAIAVDKNVRDSFAAGECDEKFDDYKADYDKIRAEIEAIMAAWTDDYTAAVNAANNDYLVKNGVLLLEGDDTLTNLVTLYEQTVEWINEYRVPSYMKNTFYSMLVDDPVYIENHHDLQALMSNPESLPLYSTDLAALQLLTRTLDEEGKLKDTGDYIILENLNGTDLTANETKAKALLDKLISLSKTIKDTIKSTVENIDKTGVSVAEKYFTEVRNGEAWVNFTTVRDNLIALGFDNDEAVKATQSVRSPLDAAYVTYYEKLGKVTEAETALAEVDTTDPDAVYEAMVDLETAKHNLIIAMNGIAEKVDPIAEMDVDKKVSELVVAQWDNTYNKATEDINKWIGTEDFPASSAEKLMDIKNQMDKLNTAWSAVSPGKRNESFSDYYNGTADTKGLKQLYADAKAIFDAFNDVVVNNKVFNDLLALDNSDSYLAKTRAALNEFITLFGYNLPSQAGSTGAQVDTYQSQIDNIVNKVVNAYYQCKLTEADLVDKDKVADNTFAENFNNLIATISSENSYKTQFGKAKTYISNNLVNQAKAALNNVRQELGSSYDTQFNDYSSKIAAIKTKVDALSYDKNNPGGDLFVVKAKSDEKSYAQQLCELIALIDADGNFDSVEDSQTILESRYDKVYTDIERFQENVKADGAEAGKYGTEVADKYVEEGNKLSDRLTKLSYEFVANADLVAEVDYYTYELERVKYVLNTYIKPAWLKAQNTAEAYFASDNYGEELLKVLNNYVDLAKYANKEVKDYNKGNDPLQYDYVVITNTINGAELYDGTYMPGYKDTVDENMDKHAYDQDLYDSNLNTFKGIEPDLNDYVTSDLTDAFAGYRGDAVKQIANLISAVAGTSNQYGWNYSYPDQEELINSLSLKLQELQNLDATPISKVPSAGNTVVDPLKPETYVIVSAAKSKATYDALKTQVKAILDSATALVDEAGESKYIKGDLDRDGDITIIDVQQLIKFVGEGVDFEDDPDMKNRADVDGNGQINVGDVTTLINAWKNQSVSGPQKIQAYRHAAGGNNSMRVEEIEGVNGLRRYAVAISNEAAFAAGQLDITLPAGSNIAAITLGERAEGLDAYVFDNYGYTRVIMTALDNTLIKGNNGTVLYIDVEGSADVTVDNAIFSDAVGRTYDLSNSGSGVEGIYESIKDGVKAIYNAAGQKLRNMTKGVNILRNADGSTTKKVGK